MKKFFIALLCAVFFVAGGFAGAEINEMIELPYEQGQLSGLTFVRGNVAYVKFFSGLSTIDSTYFWNDLIILGDMEVKKVEIYINSPGGDAFTGLSLSDQIDRAQANGFEITAHASGIIASAAVPVFAVCNKRYASPGTIFMLRERYIGKLVDNSNMTKEEWEKMEKKTTWFCAEKALEYGLVDEIK